MAEDDRDRRIAELEARLASNKPPPVQVDIRTAKAGAGFSGGFFGCFGILAAILVVIIVLFVIGRSATTGAQNDAASSGDGSAPRVSVEDWVYNTEADSLGGAATQMACIPSIDEIHLTFPYKDTGAKLCVRRAARMGLNVYVQLAGDGQFSCAINCSVAVRFGDGQARRFSASEAADGSTGILFINGERAFIQSAKSVKSIVVEASYFEHGVQPLTFKSTAPLVWK